MKKKECGKKEEKGENKTLCMIKAQAVAFAITCIIFIGCGMLLTFTELSESKVPVIALVCTALAAAVAGFDWASCQKKRGLIWGMAAGAVYAVILCFVLSAASGDFTPQLSLGMHFIIAVAAGGAGGILAMNRKSKR